ncbi:MAG: hypothetical protein WCJ25_00335 [Candidatus Moraniibacteriota bacterium]
MNKKLIFLFLFIGSTAGSYVPMLWGDGMFSMASVLWSTIGGFVGIYVGYKIGERFG